MPGKKKTKQPAGNAPGEAIQKVSQLQYVKAGQAIPVDHVLTPGGYRHKSLVHPIGSGEGVARRSGKSRTLNLSTKTVRGLLPKLPKGIGIPLLGSGWITYASWANTTGQPISLFSTSWTVPPAPATQSGQTIFIFNSLADAAQDDIVQPVLQWGAGAPGGGNYWAVASPQRRKAFPNCSSTLVPVDEGRPLGGKITLTDQSGGSFSSLAEFESIPGTALPVQNITELVTATETLEAYQLSACSDYPNSPGTSMTSIDLRANNSPVLMAWTPTNKVVDCGQKTNIVSNTNPGGQVDLIY